MNAFEKATGQGTPFTTWPVDDEGNPMVLISFGIGEKIGLPNYSNVDINPITCTKFVKEGTETEGYKRLAEITEAVLAEERAKVLEGLQAAK